MQNQKERNSGKLIKKVKSRIRESRKKNRAKKTRMKKDLIKKSQMKKIWKLSVQREISMRKILLIT